MMSSNTTDFKVNKNKLLVLRVGSANGQVQVHRNKPVSLYGEKLIEKEEIETWRKSIRRPPVRKGIFVFPFPFHDEYYYHHFFLKQMPKSYIKEKETLYSFYKELETDTDFNAYDELLDELWKKEDKKLKDIKEKNKQKKIWISGEFYSHVPPKGMVDDGRIWWKYSNVREWIESARRYLFVRLEDGKYHYRYDRGYLELFIPE